MHIESIRWRSGFSSKVSAEDAHREIERIRAKKGGKVQASDLVDAARNKRCKLHPAFDWDDASAAKKHREQVARTMIRSIEVKYAEAPDTGVPLYQPVTVKRASRAVRAKKAYQTLDEVLEDPEKRSIMIGDAICDLVRVRRKYAALQELAAVFASIDEAVEQLEQAETAAAK